MAIALVPDPIVKTRVNVYMPATLQVQLQQIASASKRSVNAVSVMLLERAIADMQREGRIAL